MRMKSKPYLKKRQIEIFTVLFYFGGQDIWVSYEVPSVRLLAMDLKISDVLAKVIKSVITRRNLSFCYFPFSPVQHMYK